MTKAQELELLGLVFTAWILTDPVLSMVLPESTVNDLNSSPAVQLDPHAPVISFLR